MNILIANVGNIRRQEIAALASALNKNHNVTISCMASDSSFRGQSFSFSANPVRVESMSYKEILKSKTKEYDDIAVYEFYSTPADAVNILLGEVLKTRLPDIVICGIGNGLNMGTDIYSSSNVGMAFETLYFGIPVIVLSTEYRLGGHTIESVAPIVKFIEKNVERFANLKLPPHTFLNINFPHVSAYSEYRGVKNTYMGKNTLELKFEESVNTTKGIISYWSRVVNPRVNLMEGEVVEKTFIDQQYITITPISYDSTDYESIGKWGKIVEEIQGGAK